MPAEHAEPGTGALWLNVTDLAAHLGVKKSTVSERAKALAAAGHIETRPGKGRAVLIPVAAYLRAIGQTGNAAMESAAATRAALAAAADDDPPPATAPAFRDAQTREKQLAADLKELELAERKRELVRIADLREVAEVAAELIAAAIDRLAARADDMAAAVARDGTAGARAQYKRDARDLRAAIAAAFEKLGTIAPEPLPAPPALAAIAGDDSDATVTTDA